MTQPIVRPAQPSDLSILSEYWYDRMALIAHQQASVHLRADARAVWEQNAHGWLNDINTRAVVSIQQDEVIGGLFVRIGDDAPGILTQQSATVLALVIDLHTVHQRQGVGRILWQAMKAQLQVDGMTRLYAPVPTGDMLESTFWSSLGAWPAERGFGLDI